MIRAFIIVGLLVALTVQAQETTQQFNATVEGTARTPDVPLYYADDAPYLPLVELAQELGGSARVISPSEAEITVNGKMATVSLNGLMYKSGGETGSLSKPFLPYEREVLAPRDEVVNFFRTAFGVELAEGTAAAPAPAEGASLTEEEQGLLESVPLPPPGEAAPAAPDAGAEAMEEEPPLLESEGIAAPQEEVKPGAFKTLVIDAGHGGEDAGAQADAGTAEKDICLGIAQRLAQQLQNNGRFTVVMTRNDDTGPGLDVRAAMIAQQEKPFVVSIHTGASVSPDAEGIEVFYPSEYSRSRVSGAKAREAAELIAAKLSAETGAPMRGVKRAPLKLMKNTEAPGCLVETGCISNAAEANRLSTADYQEKIARGLALGIMELAGAS